MTELLGQERRSVYCGTLRESDIGKEVCVMGWVKRRRALGGLVFIDLRDRSGIVQLAFDDNSDRQVFDKAESVRSEFVLSAKGIVRERSSKNPELPTGNIEVFVTSLKILAESETPPFEIIDACGANEELRLKYRYLDLRRSVLTENLIFRSKVAKITRDYFCDNGFIEIETPMLIRSTPEGARDYLVPSRVRKGSFYALPQSPQLYKQLSMVAGFDKYFQLARCFRDEDLRADRQPEFTQIDLEMSFVDTDDVLKMAEGYISYLFDKALGVKIQTPIPRYSYRQVMDRFGSDKPDIRFGNEITDISDCVKDCGFSVFTDTIKKGGSVRALCFNDCADKLTRKEIEKLGDYAKGCGASGMAWLRRHEQVSGSILKYLSEDELNAIFATTGCGENGVVLILADTDKNKLLPQLGQLRLEAANRLAIKREGYSFLWVVEMPFFEYDAESGEWLAMHHPFTAPLDECLPYLETDKAQVRAKAYDLVLNGIELSSGSIRITNPQLQSTIFRLLGLSEEESKAKFGYLLEAFKYGAPPHGGMALGLDRLVMQMLGAESLRDVVAFPKVQNASEPMTDCPAGVDEKALCDLGIDIRKDKPITE